MPATVDAAFMTVAETAAKLSIDVEGVLELVHAGTLPAIDVRRPGAARPRWRVDPQDLAAFVQSRKTATPTPKPTRRRRQTDVIPFF